eukprot:scaffold370760_cov15-Prasinocladus_malaysianus.AAC.2
MRESSECSEHRRGITMLRQPTVGTTIRKAVAAAAAGTLFCTLLLHLFNLQGVSPVIHLGLEFVVGVGLRL